MYKSISCELLADAAVLPGLPNEPFSRFTPNAAQSRSDRICAGSSLVLILRVVLRSLRAARTDFPPSMSGLGSVICFRSCVALGVSWVKPAVVLASTVKAGRAFTNVLRFIEFSRLVGVVISAHVASHGFHLGNHKAHRVKHQIRCLV